MPDPSVYECPRTPTAPNLDGTLTDPAWEVAPWTPDFVPIADGPAPRFRTRAKLMYDDQYLYVGGVLEDLILHHIKQLFDAEEAFTADWIAKHH